MRAPMFASISSPCVTLAAAIVAAALASAASASTGAAYRVKDLNPTPGDAKVYEIQPLASTGTLALAWGEVRHESGPTAWVTDGTAAGTRRLRDLEPAGSQSDPSGAAAIGGGILFPADSPGTGVELWWTDGTIPGTRLVRDIRPGRLGSNPVPLGVLSGLYLFAADDGEHGRELWSSDGTPAGTVMVADLRAGAEGSLGDAAGGTFNGRLYFSADDGVHGPELWRTDGHPAGTYLLKSLIAGAAGGNPGDFRVAGSRLIFAGTDATHGRELWATDGTAAGTALVEDLRPGAASSDPEPFESLPGRALLAAEDGTHGRVLWASDGTAAGTGVIALIRPGFEADQSEPPVWSGRIGSRAVFAASDGTGVLAWTSNGTVAGTTLLCGGLPPAVACGQPQGFATVAGALVFAAYVGEGEYGIWRTDGTNPGTGLLATQDGGVYIEVAPAVSAGGAWVLSIYRIYFRGPSYDDERVLWRTDGTPGGTVRVDVLSAPQSPSYPGRLAARDAGVVFDTGYVEIYRSDGTEAGTAPLEYPEPGDLWSFEQAAPLPGGELAFAADNSENGIGLFRTEGNDAASIAWLGSFPDPLTSSGGLVYFAHDRPGDDDLWRTDGTPAGTEILGSFDGPFGLADVFGRLWFGAARGEDAWSLWESSGTVATTIEHPLGAIPFTGWQPLAIVPLDPARGSFTFQADDGLHLFDPVAGSATLFHPLVRFSNGDDLAVLGGALFFFDEEPDGSCTLWRSLGTTASTARVRTWNAGGCIAEQMAVLDGRLYFAACNLTAGCELWASDGTESGTGMVKDIDPGMFSSTPAWPTPADHRLYFVACDGWAGCEPWVSDGTARGTHRVGDIAPGPASSLSPSFQSYQDTTTPNLVPSNRRVFFNADDGTGTELWAAPVELFSDGFESGDTSRWEVF